MVSDGESENIERLNLIAGQTEETVASWVPLKVEVAVDKTLVLMARLLL